MQLTNEQVNHLRGLLQDEMEDVRDRMDENGSFDMVGSMRDQLSELSFYDNHPGDIGTEVFERGKDLALRDQYSLRLAEIDEALERMEDGNYGTCLHCGKEIPLARLEAEPAAKHCVDCQEQEDELEISANRPVEENFLYPGFGRTFMDRNEEDQNGYDGEDAWQDVAKYGTAATTDEHPSARHPNNMFSDEDDRIGYVDDIEGFLMADLDGSPMTEGPPFVRNEAYRRKWQELYHDDQSHRSAREDIDLS
jgi:YteA family regulatory protein